MGVLSVALVYPPFGPSGLPSLGLSLLAASLRSEGRRVAVDYWNLEVLAGLPLPDAQARDRAYRRLSDGTLFPWNEWAYSGAAYGSLDPVTKAEMRSVLSDEDKRLISALADGAEADVARAAERLLHFDVVGIASTFYQIAPAVALARALKLRRPEIVTVMGGANADGEMGEGQLELHRDFDYVIGGEADHAFQAFLKALEGSGPFKTVPGLLRRGPCGGVLKGAPAQMVEDLDALPIPDFSDYVAAWRVAGLGRVNRLALALESSRGCWWGEHNHCIFCGLNANGMHFRRKTFARFAREVEAVHSAYDAPFLFMADNILALDYLEQLRAWADRRGIDAEFFYEIKSNLKREQVSRLASAGVATVQPGIESFSTSVLRLMRKGLRGIQNVAFLKYAADAGMRPVYNLLTGFPGEDPADQRRMVESLPQLFHLFPPTSAPLLEFHRFSPYHMRPEDFDLRLRPDPRYARFLPFDESETARIAYRFVAEGRVVPDYLPDLSQMLACWRSAYRSGEARLVVEAVSEGLLVTDTRTSDWPRRTLLIGAAAQAHETLDRPHSAASLAASLAPVSGEAGPDIANYLGMMARYPASQVVWFGSEELAATPSACLDLMVDAGVIYREAEPGQDPLYLALATRPQPERTLAGLERLGI